MHQSQGLHFLHLPPLRKRERENSSTVVNLNLLLTVAWDLLYLLLKMNECSCVLIMRWQVLEHRTRNKYSNCWSCYKNSVPINAAPVMLTDQQKYQPKISQACYQPVEKYPDLKLLNPTWFYIPQVSSYGFYFIINIPHASQWLLLPLLPPQHQALIYCGTDYYTLSSKQCFVINFRSTITCQIKGRIRSFLAIIVDRFIPDMHRKYLFTNSHVIQLSLIRRHCA